MRKQSITKSIELQLNDTWQDYCLEESTNQFIDLFLCLGVAADLLGVNKADLPKRVMLTVSTQPFDGAVRYLIGMHVAVDEEDESLCYYNRSGEGFSADNWHLMYTKMEMFLMELFNYQKKKHKRKDVPIYVQLKPCQPKPQSQPDRKRFAEPYWRVR